MPSSELLMERSGTLDVEMEMEMGLGVGRMLEEEQRALQIALDQLSMLGLGEEQEGPELPEDDGEDEEPNLNNNNNNTGAHHHLHHQPQHHHHQRDTYLAALYEGGEAKKKSCNTTECVPVPSSEHVAEIVGRQGCKIKALRAKTNTYIKTPVRGEEPVFVVTGRREDVAMARREIISAAEHFSLIRASRNKDGAVNGTVPIPPNLPGQTTIQVRVPYRVVGLVVGPKGATIKRIQQQTHTYIVTPSRDKEPVFEVTGMPANVDRAREEIEAHIAMRTGGIVELNDENDFHCNGLDSGFGARQHKAWGKSALGSGRKPLSSFRSNGAAATDYFYGNVKLADHHHHGPFSNGVVYGEPYFGADGRELTAGGMETAGHLWTHQELANPALGALASPAQRRSSSAGGIPPLPHLSPTLPDAGGGGGGIIPVHSTARRVHSDPLQANPRGGNPPPSGSPSPAGGGGGLPSAVRHLSTRECQVCFESEVTAALVPCGHNLFCMECANRICQRSNPHCPACLTTVTQAIRIFS
ncbi:RNA-binding protein MEX3B-like [Heterodontus francisci]|uniref:RNA-binding protein MEX3B-like n=1 Tax=Heterodontus francisci TaxID=7792 RepID=UPI00355AFC1D